MKTQSSTSVGWDKTAQGISFAVILIALVELAGWHAQIRVAVQIHPGFVPMQYNTALCFLALGAAGIGLSARKRLLMACGGSVAALMGAAVILEYTTGVSFGIDTLLFEPWERTLSTQQERMCPTTAISFFLTGVALVTLSARRNAYGVFGVVNSIPLSLAVTSLIGYAFHIAYILPFGLGSRMALHTSAAFLAYGIAMMGYAWKYGERAADGLPKWAAGIGVALLPELLLAANALFPEQSWRVVSIEALVSVLGVALVTFAVIRLTEAKVAYKGLLMIAIPLILLLTFVALVVNVRHKSEAAQASALHSKEVSGLSQSLLAQVTEAESAVRGYIVTGDEEFFNSYVRSAHSVTQATTQFGNLVSSNPLREASAGTIVLLTAEKMSRLSSTVELLKTGKKKQVEQRVKGGAGAALMLQLRKEIGDFTREEERIGDERQRILDVLWRELSWLLVAGTAASILLASILTLLFSGGISRRLRQLRDNAINLAAGQELAPPLIGRDEIAELDSVFHKMAESLDEATRREKAVIEGTTDGIFVKDLQNRYLMINQSGADLLSKTVEEIVGASTSELFAPESVRRILELDDETIANGKTTSYELQVTTTAGVERTFLTTRGPYRDRQGNIVGIVGINRDITERRRAEAEQKVIAGIVQGVIAAASLGELFDLVHASIGTLLSAENCFIALYDKTSDLLHIPFCKDEFDPIAAPKRLGRGLTAFVLRTGRPMLLTPRLIQDLVSEGEVELVGTLPAAWIGVPLRASNETIGVLVVQDYRDRGAYSQPDVELLASVADQLGLAIVHKQVEIELKTNEIQLTAAQKIAHVGSWEWDVISQKFRWSEELFCIFGFVPRETGPSVREFFAHVHLEDVKVVESAIEQAFRRGVVPSFDFRIVRSDHTIRMLQINGEVVADETGRLIKVLGTTQDITERNRAQNERDVISEIIRGVNLTSNLDELLKQAHQSLKRVLYAENCCVALFDKQTGLFEAALFVDLGAQANPFPMALSKNCTSKVFTSRQPLLMNEAIFDSLLERGELEAVGRRAPSFLAVPLVTPAETIGVIVVQHYELDNVYGQQDVEFLSAVAAQLALAIERKRAQDALIESDRRFRDLFYDAPVGYHELDTNGRITCVNTTELSMLGYSSEEMIGHHVWEFIEESELARATFAEKLAGIKPHRNVERSFRRKDGTFMAVQLDDQMLRDPSGRFIGIRATMQDIVDRKRTEEALRQSEQRFRDLFENASDVIYTADVEGNFTSLNSSGERMTGYTREEALHLNFSQVVSPETLKLVQEMNARKLNSPDETVYEVEFFKKGGDPLLVEVSSRAIYKDGKPVGIQGIGRDITQRKLVEAELKLARDAALESVRLKSEFLANMSHEIRTPMNGVIGMTGLLLDTDLTDEQRDYADTINSSAEALLTIIDDILDFSKIEAGLLRFETIDFDLLVAVEATVDLLAERAQGKGLELASFVHHDVPTALMGDPGRLRQVLTNLAGNAVKFTQRGEVVVSVRVVSETTSAAMLRFETRDTGIGVSTEGQQRLFRAFTQADGSTTRKYGGTGLGLAISKQLVELMGGEIGIESTPGHGSTFWFTAQFEKQPSAATNASNNHRGLSGARVLIVDDNASIRSILNHQASSWGMATSEAESGRRALELLRAGASDGKPFDIVLLDLMMPGMSGFQVAEAVKADLSIAAVALVLLPAFGMHGIDEQTRQAGIDAFLQKPVRQSKLFDCLATIVARSSGRSRMPALKRPPGRGADGRQVDEKVSNIRIIIAEDNVVNRKVALGQLYNLGYSAEAVSTGTELLQAMANAEYDLILMDCQMPEMDGFAASAEIRRREGNTRHTTIIAMTANALDGDADKCLAAGMDDYLSKPVKAQILRQKLERWTRPEGVSPGGAPSEAVVAEGNLCRNGIDLAQLASMRALQRPGQADFATELIDLFVNQTVYQLKVIHEAVAKDDATEIERVSHLLRGSSASIGARQMAELCEQLGRKNGANGDSEAILKKLDDEFELVREALNAERIRTSV